MATPPDVGELFARTLDLFRDPGAKEAQKARFRTLTGTLKAEGVTISALDGRLLVDGAAVEAATLLQRLEVHSGKGIGIPAEPPGTEEVGLRRARADMPRAQGLAAPLQG